MHAEEHTWTPNPIIGYQAYRDSVIPAACTGTPSVRYNLSLSVPSGISAGRCASQHSQPNQFGWRPPTPYWGYRWAYSAAASYGRPYYKTYPTQTQSFGNDCPIVVSKALPSGWTDAIFRSYRPYFGSLEAGCITLALAELGSSMAESAVELVEARKTAKMLGDTLWTLWEDVEDVMHRRVPRRWLSTCRKIKADPIGWAAKALPERWLEGRYGWSPLVYSVFDFLKLLDSQTARPLIVTARKSSKDEVSSSSVVTGKVGPYWPISVYIHTEVVERKSVYVVLTMKVNDVERMTANDAGVLNPATATWEALPFSWMVDWLVGVGSYLNARSALEFLSLYGGTATHKHEMTTSVWYTPWWPNTSHYWCSPPSDSRATAGGHSFQRRVLMGGDLDPSLSWGSGINLVRSLDAVSLIYNAFRGKSVLGLRV